MCPLGSDTGFWNFRFKLILLIALLMAGTLSVQSVIRNHSIQVILDGAEKVAAEIANEAAEKILIATSTEGSNAWLGRGLNSPYFSNASELKLKLDHQQVLLLTEQFGSALTAKDVNAIMGIEESLLEMLYAFQPDLRSSVFVEAQRQWADNAAGNSDTMTQASVRNSGPSEIAMKQGNGEIPVAKSDRIRRIDVPMANLSETDTPKPKIATNLAVIEKKPAVHPDVYGSRSSAIGKAAEDQNSEKLLLKEEIDSEEIPASTGDPDDLTIDLEAPLAELGQLVRETNDRDLYATLSVFLIGLILAWVLGSRLVKPVTEVVDGMQKVALGDMTVRLPGQRDAEFALINGQFNEMVQQLENARSLERGLEHRERLQTMGDLAAGVAHDIRNPLSAISMIVGRLGHDYAPAGEEHRKEFLAHTKDIKDEIERLNNLVTDFLQLAQPNSQEAEPCHVDSLLDDLCRLLDKEAAGHQVVIEKEIQANLSQTRWNPVEGKSAFLNVAMNALQAMEAVGGTLKIQARSDDHWIVVSFKDNGPGIAEEDREKVMLPYVTRRPGGTGLGLAIARRVAERYGGRLELTSQVGVGTEVRFLLPVFLTGDKK